MSPKKSTHDALQEKVGLSKKMTIHMVKTTQVTNDLMSQIHTRISSVNGPVEYLWDKERNHLGTDDARTTMSWEELFSMCEAFRKEHKIADKDVVVLFTNIRNDRNWFSSWDETARLNFFIHTEGYEQIIEADPEYPLVYELASVPLVIASFDDIKVAEAYAHQESRGCVFDFTRNKKEAQLRLRTADVCDECRNLLKERKADPAVLRQNFAVFDNIRAQMLYRTRFELLQELSHVVLRISQKSLEFTDLAVRVKLKPREFALYQLFMKNKDGIEFKKMDEKESDLLDYYKLCSGKSNIVKVNTTIKNLIDLKDRSAFDETVHGINNKIRNAIGKAVSPKYELRTINGLYMIEIDRSLVTYDPK